MYRPSNLSFKRSFTFHDQVGNHHLQKENFCIFLSKRPVFILHTSVFFLWLGCNFASFQIKHKTKLELSFFEIVTILELWDNIIVMFILLSSNRKSSRTNTPIQFCNPAITFNYNISCKNFIFFSTIYIVWQVTLWML